MTLFALGFIKKPPPVQHQSGQSVVEALVLMLVLIVMFTAIPWLGRVSDIGLQQANASRYAAFQLARHGEGVDERELKHRFFLGQQHQWKDRVNEDMIKNDSIHITIDREKQLSEQSQPGGDGHHQSILRREWQIGDQGIASIHINTRPQYTKTGASSEESMSPGLSFFDQHVLNIQRHISILTGAAHSSTDLSSHQRAGQSSLAWKEAAEASYESSAKVTDVAAPVDAAWDRPQPVFDWLTPWAGQLPAHHIEAERKD